MTGQVRASIRNTRDEAPIYAAQLQLQGDLNGSIWGACMENKVNRVDFRHSLRHANLWSAFADEGSFEKQVSPSAPWSVVNIRPRSLRRHEIRTGIDQMRY